MMYYSNSEKEIPSVPIRSRTLDLPITSSDALPLSYRRLMGAKAIKGSWDKHPAYCPFVFGARKQIYHVSRLKRETGFSVNQQVSLEIRDSVP